MPTKVKELLALLQADGWRLVRQKARGSSHHVRRQPAGRRVLYLSAYFSIEQIERLSP